MQKIQLTQNKVALVDDEDFEYLNQFKWFAQRIHNTFYACRHERGQKKYIYMHREILGEIPEGKMVDHIDGNGVDNQKANLRIVTNRENLQNRHHNRSSKFPGVHSSGRIKNPWKTAIQINGKIRGLGSFPTEEAAHSAYQEACNGIK